jgi:hypothetical protein
MRSTLQLALILCLPVTLAQAQASSVSGPPMELDQATARRLHAAMTQDLKNLVLAQEAYFAEHAEYAADFQRGAIKGAVLRVSPGVTVTMTYVTKQTYAARATHDWLGGRSCVLTVGAVARSRVPLTTADKRAPTKDGVPVCDAHGTTVRRADHPGT